MASLLIRNIGTLLSGDLERPLLKADSVYVEDGLIRELGTQPRADQVVDARGATVMPGIVDSHHHPYFGDYHPSISAIGYADRYVEAGVTAAISMGPYAFPGHPLGAKHGVALAIVTTQSYLKVRPSGLKVFAETMIVEPGLEKADIAQAAAGGVRRVKFLLPVPTAAEARRVVDWAHAYGLQVQAHCGGRKLVDEAATIGEALQVIRPDIAAHLNGGPTPPSWDDAVWLIEHTSCYVDLVFGGNFKLAAELTTFLAERGELWRVLIGTDSPTIGGSAPGGTAKLLAHICSATDLAPEIGVCLMTRTTGRAYDLPIGLIAPGRPADLVICDAREGSVASDALAELEQGNVPATGAVIIDGVVVSPSTPRFPTGRYVSRAGSKRPPLFL
jgi:enamidase